MTWGKVHYLELVSWSKLEQLAADCDETTIGWLGRRENKNTSDMMNNINNTIAFMVIYIIL